MWMLGIKGVIWKSKQCSFLMSVHSKVLGNGHLFLMKLKIYTLTDLKDMHRWR